MYIIPVKYDKNFPYIFELVNSIRLFSQDKILIVDSNSNDKSYLSQIKDVDIADINNKHYIDGAIWYGYEHFTDENFFYILHDSMKILKNLENYKYNDFTSFSYFNLAYDSHDQFLYVRDSINKLNLNYDNDFYGLFGITFFCQRQVLDKLYNIGLNTILPSNKIEMMGSERIWGYCLKHIGINISQSSLHGKYINKEDLCTNNIVKKYFLHRI